MSATEDEDLLAAELALGLLDEPERSRAEARLGADRHFAALVEEWRVRLEPMLASSPEVPPERVWEAIRSRLPANDDALPAASQAALRRWRVTGIVASAIAASLALLLVTRDPLQPPPTVAPEAPPPMLVATLQSEETPALVTIAVDPGGRLVLTPVRLPTEDRVPELWVIPEDGTPRSLGVIQAGGPSSVPLPPAYRSFVRQGATFAISREPPGGSPTGAPTGPVVASGKITAV